jgi:hypothetical protein
MADTKGVLVGVGVEVAVLKPTIWVEVGLAVELGVLCTTEAVAVNVDVPCTAEAVAVNVGVLCTAEAVGVGVRVDELVGMEVRVTVGVMVAVPAEQLACTFTLLLGSMAIESAMMEATFVTDWLAPQATVPCQVKEPPPSQK